MDLGLSGKVALVTGAGRNVGAEIARMLAQEGARVAVTDVDAATAESTAQAIRDAGGDAKGYALDVSDEAMVARVVDAVEADLGPIDVLVNNAARLPGFTTFAQEAVEAPNARPWDGFLDVNYRGLLHTMAAVVPRMAERKRGQIVSVASDAGKLGENRQAVYASTKSAVIGLTKSLAQELGSSGVRVNAVCPSMIKTAQMAEALTEDLEARILKRYPLRRLGRPEDVAALVVFLASEQASWITGQAMSVNGGYCMA